MKLIIQIPCYNEADTLPAVLAELPQQIPSISQIETLIIDDGSQDATIQVAKEWGVTHILPNIGNKGLAYSFQRGMEYALKQGADIIVNTDGDNQYPGEFIPALVAPILQNQADMVIGDRQTDRNPHFPLLKKRLQKLGSYVVRTISGTTVADTVSGFRAYSKEAALRLNVLSHYSYTLETIIQAGKIGLNIVSIPITTNAATRPSRLQRHMWHFIKAQTSTMLRVYAFYEPLRTFSYVSLPFLLVGGALWGRLFYFRYLSGVWESTRFIQSVTISTGLLIIGFLILIFGFQADIASKHRQLTQEILYRLRKEEIERLEIGD